MSNSTMASSSSFMLKVDLDELDEPHKLAKWFQILPKYRKYFRQSKEHKNDKIDHQSNCQSLSEFLYQTQYCGKHIKYGFTESDFKQLLSIIHDTNDSYRYKDYKWIWKIIAYAQKAEKDSNESLKWINTTWKKFEIMEQNELIQNTQNNYGNSPINVIKSYESKSEQKNERSNECTDKLDISENKPNKSVNIHMEFTNVNECDRSDDFLRTPTDDSAMVFGSIDAEEQMMLATSIDKGNNRNRARIPTESNNDENMYEFGGKMRQKSKTKDGYMQAASTDDITDTHEYNPSKSEQLTKDGYKSVSLNDSLNGSLHEEGRSESYNDNIENKCCCIVM